MRKSVIVAFASAAILLAAIIIAFVRADDRNQATVSLAETANHSSKHSNPPEQSSKTGAVTEAGLDETNNVPTPVQAASPLSEEEALAIAKRELGDYGYDHDAPIVVRRGPGYFDFIFPEPHHGALDDDDYYGADFAARVRVDSRTGAIMEIEVGG